MRWRLLNAIVLLLALAAAPAVALAEQSAAEEQYANAAGHYAGGRWQLADAEFEKFLADYPTHARRAQAQFYRGEALVQLGDYAAARKQFSELLERQPPARLARQALFRRGEAALLGGEHELAETDLQEFHRLYPQDELDSFVLPYLGDLALQHHRAAAAKEFFTAAQQRFAKGPLSAECEFGLARCLELEGDLESAARKYWKLAERPDGPLADRAQYQLGVMYNDAQRYAEAEIALAPFEGPLNQSPLRDRAALARGWALYKSGRHDEAEALLRRVPSDAAQGADARYWLGMVKLARQQWTPAAELLSAAATEYPSHELAPAMRYQAGNAWVAANEPAKAAAQFDAAAHEYPNSRWAPECLLGQIKTAQMQADHAGVARLTKEFLETYPSRANEPGVRLARAAALASLGKNEDAVTALSSRAGAETADVSQEQKAQSSVLLALSLTRLGRVEEAKKAYAERNVSAGANSQIAPVCLQLAEAASAGGEKTWSREIYVSLTSASSPPEIASRAWAGLAWSQFQAEELSEAAASFERLLAKYPNDPLAGESAFMRGQALQRLGQSDGALAMYELVLEKYPQNVHAPEAIFYAARLHDKLQQDHEADALYRRLVEQYPNFPQLDAALYQWGWVQHELGNQAAATALWTRLNHDFPESHLRADGLYRLADDALAQKQFDEAAALAKDALAANPGDDVRQHLLYLQSRLAIARGRWEDVAPPLQELCEKYPDSSLCLSAKYWMAESTYRRGKFAEAAAEFGELARLTPGHAEKWEPLVPLRIAQSLAQQKRWVEAYDIASKIEAEYPGFAQQYEVDYLIGRCLADQADFVAARAAYAKVLRSAEGGQTETAAMAQWMIGESYFHQKEYEQALREYLRVEIVYPHPRWQSGALLQAGKCQETLGQWSQSIETYARLLKNYPDSEYAAEAKRRLSVAQQRAAKRN